MSGGQRQAVAIARSVMWSQDILILDEPTAALGMRESDAVLGLIESVRARGLTVILVSHALPHIMRVADRAVVMRHGRVVADIERENLDADHLVGLIVGSR
jgi:ABC-type sugar transport system ATPase subunit